MFLVTFFNLWEYFWYISHLLKNWDVCCLWCHFT